MRKIVFSFLLVTCFARNLFAENKLPANIRFGRISVDKGLSHATVYCSFQDSQGFMWFGTEDGLNKYDGYSFEVYKSDPADRRTISNNIIRCIFEDSKQNLWVGTDNGLNVYNRSNGSFSHYQNVASDAASLSNNIVSSLAEDKNGTLWIGTSGGLNAFDHATKKFTVYKNNPSDFSSISSNVISSLAVDAAGILWIGTAANGLNAFDPATKKCRRFQSVTNDKQSLSENEITCLKADHSGALWIGTLNGGLNALNTSTGKFTRYTSEPGGLSQNSVFSVCEDKTGMVWIATMGGGLDAFDPASGKFMVYKYDRQNIESLSSNKTWNIFEDNAGTIWISTSGGVSYYNRTISKFVTYQANPGADGEVNNNVYSIYEDQEGRVWTGILGGGLNVFSRSEGKFVNEKYSFLTNPLLRFSNIFAIYEDLDGTLLLGTTDGLIALEPSSGKITVYKNKANDPSSLSNNYVRSIFQDRSASIWIGTLGGGLNLFDKKNGKFSSFKNNPSDPSSISNNVVTDIYEEDKDGILWIGTYGGGLNAFDRKSKKFTAYKTDVNNLKSISSNFVQCLYHDASGNLWIGTYGGGLNVLDKTTSVFTHYTERDGLPNNIVNGILADFHGYLWISTNNGVCKLKPASEDQSTQLNFSRSYSVVDGLQNKFNENACFIGKNGWMYFGGSNGLNAFHPDSIHDNTIIPPVAITRFFLFEKPSRMDTLITNKKTIDLKYDQNFFSFEFSALNFIFPDKNRYAYKMEGLPGIDHWTYIGTSRTKSFTNIDPGVYTFRVRACNNDGFWNNEGIAIVITIKPPFWKTWWFMILSVITVVFVIFMYIRLRTRTLVRQNVVLEEKVNQRTSELKEKNEELTHTMDHLRSTQDQLVQSEKMASLGQLTAGIAHEIQNPLNFVNNFSELSVDLINEMETIPDEEEKKFIIEDIKQNLTKINHHGKRADSIVKGMLMHSRTGVPEKQLTDVNKLVDEFITLAFHGIRAKDNSFNCEIEKSLAEGLPSVQIIPQEISRVLLNIFNNAFYAVDERKKKDKNNYQPVVTLTTRKENNHIIIGIRDNGLGIPPEIKDKIFNPFFTTKPTGQGTGLGLSISYDIITKGHQGELKVESTPGEFTEFIIGLPVR
ncbi:MAG: ATP-binding protein [Bacteroidetes bacterium]|nr:ATP-binding protein [Bacteroidota bacterium]